MCKISSHDEFAIYLQIAQKLQLFRNQEKQGISFCTFPSCCSTNPVDVFLKAVNSERMLLNMHEQEH
jgi:hypothetical protein